MITFFKIINFLGKNIQNGFTMHELSISTKIPYASFYRYAKRLIEQGVLLVEKIGKAKVVRLNINHSVQKANLTHASFEELWEYMQKNKIIKKITNELKTNDIVVLFGSYATGTQTKRSDIDMLIINKEGKKTLSFSKYEALFKVKINSLFIKRTEFVCMLQDYDENVGKQVLKKHIILNNPDKFWECVLDAVR